MVITPATTLAEIVSLNPGLTQALEHLGLDYCCGGKQRLDEACRLKTLDVESVLACLNCEPMETLSSGGWMDLAPAQLVDHVEATHHHYLKQALPRLSELAAKVSNIHGEKYPEFIQVAMVLQQIRDALEPHLIKEEKMLFPLIRILASASELPHAPCGPLHEQVAVLESEHAAVGALLEQLRTLTRGYQAPAETCASTQALMAGLAELESDTHLHVHKENNHLFPAVTAMEAQTALR
jgi:regulator of cell morphogenesis and NO signaling